MSTYWVWHKVAKGTKYKVVYTDQYGYCCRSPKEVETNYYFPGTDYEPCPPPTVTKNVTREHVRVMDNGRLLEKRLITDSERWAWQGDALIIEREEEA